jgi:hypothetical protein
MEEVSSNYSYFRFRSYYVSDGSLKHTSDIDLSLVDAVFRLAMMLAASEMHVTEMSEFHRIMVEPGTSS